MSPARKTSRREFLVGESVRSVLEDALHGAEGPPVPIRPSHSMEFSRRAMACDFAIFLNPPEMQQGAEPALDALDLIDDLEAQLTVYRDTSEVSRLNREAHHGPQAVEARLFRLIQRSIQLTEATDGAFDITSGPLGKVWGFFRRQGRLPQPEQLDAVRPLVGSRENLRLDSDSRTLAFAREGVEINFGAIGKGYALDRVAELFAERGVANYLIHAGHSSLRAGGSRTDRDRGWPVGLQHPQRPDVRIGELDLADQSLGTSGSAHQFFYHQGRRYGHVIDPRTGEPADGVLSVTVLCPQAADADALATAFHVLGPDAAEPVCQRLPEVQAIFVLPGSRRGSLEIRTIGLPDDTIRYAETNEQPAGD